MGHMVGGWMHTSSKWKQNTSNILATSWIWMVFLAELLAENSIIANDTFSQLFQTTQYKQSFVAPLKVKDV